MPHSCVHVPISASWSFSPAASCSNCDILAANSFEVSLGSATFFPFDFFAIAADDMTGLGLPAVVDGTGCCDCPFTSVAWVLATDGRREWFEIDGARGATTAITMPQITLRRASTTLNLRISHGQGRWGPARREVMLGERRAHDQQSTLVNFSSSLSQTLSTKQGVHVGFERSSEAVRATVDSGRSQ